MRGVYSVEQIRAAEGELIALLGDGELMARAAFGLSVHCARMLGRVYGARVVLLVGAGNNGGDALIAGARLARLGAQVHAVLLSPERAHRAGLDELRRAGGRVLPAGAEADVARADLVVDGIVGIGGSGGLRPDAAALVAAASDVLTVAVDIPSGVDPMTGAAGPAAVRADVTVTFGALKPGLVSGQGPAHAGRVQLVDIGLGPYLWSTQLQVLEHADVAAVLPSPQADDDKYTRGVVGVIAGSPAYPGAGVLATGAALHSGAGMVRYLGRAPGPVQARYPEVVAHPDTEPGDVRVQAWVIGPGLGTGAPAVRLVAAVLDTDVPVLIDADGVTIVAGDTTLLAALRNRTAPTVLTPHDREFARLPFELGADRIGAARTAAADLRATVLLKGNATVVASPDGSVFVNLTGTPWLATAGSGDVLSGLAGGLLAAGVGPLLAAAAAAYVHGVAGQLAATAGPVSAADVLTAIPTALRAIVHG